MSYSRWPRYVPVAERKAKARKQIEKLRKKGVDIKPVAIEGRKIARTFWGAGWCDHLESFSDYENRLPRGRTYVRNGSVCHLDIASGKIDAMVAGSSMYDVSISIKPLAASKWKKIKRECTGRIGSLIELLQGKLSSDVMSVVTDRDNGLFPRPREIEFDCTCPDWASMCKHVAAVLYGVGARLDESPELLFLLRGVDHEELIGAELESAVEGAASATGNRKGRRRIADDAVSSVFGIDMTGDDSVDAADETLAPTRKTSAATKKRKKTARKNDTEAKSKARTNNRTRPITGEAIAKLRVKFAMSRSEFSKLLGVSVPTISKWEKSTDVLHLQSRSSTAIEAVRTLSKKEAQQRLLAKE